MGNLVMTPVSTELDAVVVRARMVKREADRFVVNVGNSPVAGRANGKGDARSFAHGLDR